MLSLLRTTVRMSSAINKITQRRNSSLVSSMGNIYKNINFSGKLDDKVAIITGSSTGIGYGIAEKLGHEGCNIVISSRNETNIEQALTNLSYMRINALGVPCHVGYADQRKNLIEETMSKFNQLDVLVCNAAVNPVIGGLMDCPEIAWDKIFDINVKCVWQLIQLAVPIMKKGKRGSIIIVSSIAGMNPIDLLGAYSVSKTALLGLTKVLANELASHNIRVNCVLPGLVRTKFSEMLFQADDYMEDFINKIPMKRVGTAQDMGNMVAFLASDDSSYITGENFVVAGGMQSRL